MQHQKLFFMAIMMSSMATHNCYAAEKTVTSNTSPKPIMLDKGLLTFVPSLLVSVEDKGFFIKDYFMGDIKKTNQETLINLIASHYALVSTHNGKLSGYSGDIFYPTVVRVIENNILQNLGSFCKLLHKEAKEACRLKQAAFYPHKQGVILYSLDSNFNLDFFESKQMEIEGMLDKNAKKQIDTYLPILARLY
jgi:hypothetical protein